ncbi:MAG: hypothetical protein RL632_659 [Bacteroidota bacterium]|jgi:hypothetical protein
MKTRLAFLLLLLTLCVNAQIRPNTGVSWIVVDSVEAQLLEPLDISAIPQFAKAEFALHFPKEIEERVNRFISASKEQSEQAPNDEMLNPYLEWELRFYGEFEHISTGKKITIDGFYTTEFKSWMKNPLKPGPKHELYMDDEYRKLGDWMELPTANPFLVRFAAPDTGIWRVVFYVQTKDGNLDKSVPMEFNVVASNDPGYVHVAENQRFLALGDHFFPAIGPNIKWPETNPYMDPEFAQLMGPASENYRPNFSVPRVYEKFLEYMTKVSRNGVKTARIIQFPASNEIEWEHVGDYTSRLHMAQEMDRILEHAEELGLYLQWNMAIHLTFKFNAYGVNQWDWIDDPKTAEDGINAFGYKAAFGLVEPLDFLKNADAKKYYKQRIRYILARWGYSTRISVFEILSEISNISNINYGNESDKFYESNWPVYREWMIEMAGYIKSQYYGQVHVLTGSYSGDKAVEDSTYEDASFDLMSFNNYDISAPNFATFFTGSNTSNGKGGPRVYGVSNVYLNEDCAFVQEKHIDSYSCRSVGDSCRHNVKPLMYAETDPMQTICDTNGTEVRRAIWQSAFSGLAGAMSWEAQRTPKILIDYAFLHQFLMTYPLQKGNWHPGASQLNADGSWTYDAAAYNAMDGEPEAGAFKNADLMYLRSMTGDSAIGVITNKTYSVYSLTDCFEQEMNLPDPGYGQQKTVSLRKEGLKIKVVNRGKYLVSFYATTDPTKVIHAYTTRGKWIRLDYELPATNKDFIVLFTMKKLLSN